MANKEKAKKYVEAAKLVETGKLYEVKAFHNRYIFYTLILYTNYPNWA